MKLRIESLIGFKQINFGDADGNVSGEAVFEFLKEYNRSIHKGSLSSGIISATGGVTEVEGDTKFSKSNSTFEKINKCRIQNY